MTKVLSAINKIQAELNELATQKTLNQAQRVILSIIKLLDDSVSLDDQNLFQLFTDSDNKIRANASWFYEDQVVADRKATYKIHSENNLSIDFKLYGITKPSKRTISWVTALTPNFEDEVFNSKFNIGIDFVVPKSADKIIIILSNNYVIRVLELKGELTATYQEILSKWAGIQDFNNKKEVHSTLWESFDLQPLNKKFYEGISERFIILRQHLVKENILDEKHASLFANRLIGRVIYCWFLDKKNIINKKMNYFDSESFDSDTEYYRSRLERLFYGVLNTPTEDREYKDDVTPFLNGGLFEARETDFYKNNKLTFPKDYFDDLFGFLSGYNFTTDESTSQFQQVAIDPEMLGRIFENLLAEMTEETGEQARKAKGAFYTPREIVEYMCRESLKEYLKTKIPEDESRDKRLEQLIDRPDKEFQDQDHNWRRDWKQYKNSIIKALDDLKVLDPACGSGAFPIGMMQLLVRVYERLEARFDPYKTKLGIIEKNIYGVDIEPMAVEIARLRAWLSIIVDEESDSKKIKPLPNLEFKFICANSLIDLDKNGSSTLGDDPELAGKLQEIRDAYFKTESLNKKKNLREKYEKIVNTGESLFGESLKSKQLKTYRPFDNETSASFFNSEFMFGVDKFNLIIGNPPYVKEDMNKKAFEGLKKLECYQGKMDLWYLFGARGIDLLNTGGILSFIAINNWTTNDGASKFRNKILNDGQLISYTDFGDFKVFSAGVQTMVFLIKKNRSNDEYNVKYRKLLNSKIDYGFLPTFLSLDKEVANIAEVYDFKLNPSQYLDSYIHFTPSGITELLEKIGKEEHFKLKSEEIFSGIDVMQDFVTRTHLSKLETPAKVGDGIFVLNNGEVENLSLNKDEKNILRPYFTTKEINKFIADKSNRYWIIYGGSELNKKISLYPMIKKHLDKFKRVITSVNKPYGLHRTRNEKIFLGDKILSIRKCSEPSFSFVNFPCFVSRAFMIIKSNRIDLEYLNAVLNSKLVSFWLLHRGKMQGDNFQIDKAPLLSVPIAISEEGERERIVEISRAITNKKDRDEDANLEIKKLNDYVNQIYGLTQEEILIISGK